MNLATLRKEAKLTQMALSVRSGINIRQIQKIESGEIDINNITLRNAIALADALDVSMDDLIDREKQQNAARWYIIDDATTRDGLIDETPINAKNQADAIQQARLEWEKHLTEAERRRRDDFYVCRAKEDEDGAIDYNTMTDIYSLKKE